MEKKQTEKKECSPKNFLPKNENAENAELIQLILKDFQKPENYVVFERLKDK